MSSIPRSGITKRVLMTRPMALILGICIVLVYSLFQNLPERLGLATPDPVPACFATNNGHYKPGTRALYRVLADIRSGDVRNVEPDRQIIRDAVAAAKNCPTGSCPSEAAGKYDGRISAYLANRTWSLLAMDKLSGDDGLRWSHRAFNGVDDQFLIKDLVERVKTGRYKILKNRNYYGAIQIIAANGTLALTPCERDGPPPRL